MVKPWDEHLIKAKYHLSVSQRLFENFSNYETKRFIISSLNELANSASSLVNAFLLYSHFEKGSRIPINAKARIEVFKNTSKKELGNEFTENILIIFKIKHAHKNSPIEFLKKDKIVFLDNNEYKALTIQRLKELLNNLEKNIKQFSDILKN